MRQRPSPAQLGVDQLGVYIKWTDYTYIKRSIAINIKRKRTTALSPILWYRCTTLRIAPGYGRADRKRVAPAHQRLSRKHAPNKPTPRRKRPLQMSRTHEASPCPSPPPLPRPNINHKTTNTLTRMQHAPAFVVIGRSKERDPQCIHSESVTQYSHKQMSPEMQEMQF
jgi:hypothetical protein